MTMFKSTAILLHCIPLRGYWDKTVEARCGVDDRALLITTSATHLIIDVLLLILPLPYIRQLQISRSQKVALGGIFLLGGL